MGTEELVVAAQAGNALAMERLLTAWRPRLFRKAAALVRNEDAAQDIVQETLTRVAGNLKHLANPAAFAGWAYTILRRNGIEFFRREGRHLRETVSFDDAIAVPPPDDSRTSLDDDMHLEQCLEYLRTEDRDLLRLHYWGGLETKEIAPILGIGTGAVKTRLFRARGRLGTLLVQYGSPT